MYRVLRSILKNGARQENIPTQVASAEKGKVRVDYYVACVHPHTCMPLFVVPDHIHSEILKTLLKLGRSSPLITKKNAICRTITHSLILASEGGAYFVA